MYSNYGTPTTEAMIRIIQAKDSKFAVGIEGKFGKRWFATNLDVVAEGKGLALVQQRVSSGKPGKYTNVKKNYFLLVLKDENVVAIPVIATCRTPLALAAKRAGVQC